jgi:hypothetical protein
VVDKGNSTASTHLAWPADSRDGDQSFIRREFRAQLTL